MFERFTDSSRQVLVLAQEEAQLLGSGFIGTEHLLLGLIRESDGIAAAAMRDLGVILEVVRRRANESIGLAGTAPSGSPPFTPRSKKVLELSLREALQLGHEYIGPEHILLGIVKEGEGVGAQLLIDQVGDLSRIRQKVIGLLSGETAFRPAAEVPRPSTALPPTALESALVACSFCGRRPPSTGELVTGNGAFICQHCIRRWSRRLDQQGIRTRRFAPTQLEPMPSEGEQPEDPQTARDAIKAAFSQSRIASDDAASVPTVEHGDNLGPTLTEANRRNLGIAPEESQVNISADQIVFVDAEHAAVMFTIWIDGRQMLQPVRGDAVRVDGSWKMARSTFCQLMAMGGVQCPPLEEPGSR